MEWPDPSDEQIVIMGERSFPTATDGNLTLPLIRVGGATTQEGVIRIEAPGDLSLSYQHTNLLSPTPIQRADFQRLSRQRRSFRYSPLANIFAETSPSVWVSETDDASHHTIVRQATLDTHIDPIGIARHQYSIDLENQAANELDVSFPSDSIIRNIFVDGRKVAIQGTSDASLAVPLPVNRRFVLVQLEYDEAGAALGLWHTIKFNPPQLNAPLLAERWQLWAPPEYSVPKRARSTDSVVDACLARLFGPFLRASNETPFNLFSRRDWSKLFDSATPRADLSPFAIQWLEHIGDVATLTWEDAANENSEAWKWIDTTRLASKGITPNQPVPAGDAATPYERGIRRLQAANLILVQIEAGVILTSSEFLSEFNSELIRTNCPVIVKCEIGLSDNPITTQVTPMIDLVRPAAWTESPQIWNRIKRNDDPFIAGGWQLRGIDPSLHPTQMVYRRNVFVIAGCFTFLIVMASVWWIRNLNIKVAIGVLTAAAMLAFLLPTPFQWIGLGGFWGSLVGFFLTPAVRDRSRSNVPSFASSKRAAKLSTLGVGLITAGMLTVAARAQENPPVNEPSKTTYQVFVPTDKNGKSTGDYVLIPQALHRRLQPASADSASPTWLLKSAVYRANLIRQTGAAELLVDSVVGEYNLWVPAAGFEIELPVPAKSATLLEREARLNGRPIQLEWNAARSAVTLPIRDPGAHQLTMTFRLTNSPSTASVDLRIPRAANSTLFLNAPEDLTFLETSSATGATFREDSTGNWRIEFGPTARLHFRWAAEPSSITPTVEQLSWLRIQPEQVAWNTQLAIDTRQWPSKIIQVEVDARLRLDPIESDQPISYDAATDEGLRVFDFAIDADGDEPQLIRLNFVSAGWSGVGRLQLPHLRILGAEPSSP